MKIRNLNFSLLPILIVLAVSNNYADEEQDLIAVLQSPAGIVQKCNACLRLKTTGTAKSVPVLAALLGDEKISHAACNTLEVMPCPEAGTVLRGALDRTSGLVKAGIINTLGMRHDREAVPLLTKLLADSDIQVVAAAITALGNITGPESIAALNEASSDVSSALQAPLNEALLKCAAESVSSGDKKAAHKIYAKMYEAGTPQQFQVAAYRGLILASDEKKALNLIEKGLKGRDKSSLMASLQMAGELKSERATKVFSILLKELSPETQSRFIDVLVQHNEPSVFTALLSAAGSPNPDVRVAALKALGKAGNESAVPSLLASLASHKNIEQEAAREGLIRLRGENTTKAIAENISKVEGPAKLEVIRILGLRNDTSSIPILMKMTEDSDEALRIISIQSMAMLVNETSMKDLIELLFRTKADSQRREIEKALISACVRSAKKEQCADQIISALKGTDISNTCILLKVCSCLTSPGILNVLREGTKNSEKEVQDAAIRSLSSSQDPEAVTDQLTCASNTSNQTYRVLLLRGCIKLVDETVKIPADRKIRICKEISNITARSEEKMLVISCLGKINTIDSLTMLETFLSDSTLKTAAATAMLQIGKSPDISRADTSRLLLEKADTVLNASQKN